ncbi:hypothetical protein Pan241w_18180 [Gimesia alba]|uniref:Uncharacterized protein n=1 Tax=Gimesia alba TaxID=2527973 RepID=A0A517RCZ4_9PLAN|nr:hypothetical protein [Gimesia alba]QDT41755.1 hypothetical protein Pan241w_18180 [Gimesia alba]
MVTSSSQQQNELSTDQPDQVRKPLKQKVFRLLSLLAMWYFCALVIGDGNFFIGVKRKPGFSSPVVRLSRSTNIFSAAANSGRIAGQFRFILIGFDSRGAKIFYPTAPLWDNNSRLRND